MNVEIGAEAAQFPEKEYINGIAVAVYFPPFYFLYYLPSFLSTSFLCTSFLCTFLLSTFFLICIPSLLLSFLCTSFLCTFLLSKTFIICLPSFLPSFLCTSFQFTFFLFCLPSYLSSFMCTFLPIAFRPFLYVFLPGCLHYCCTFHSVYCPVYLNLFEWIRLMQTLLHATNHMFGLSY